MAQEDRKLLTTTSVEMGRLTFNKDTKPTFGDLSAPSTTVLKLERPDSAVSRVLVTTELLEHILLYLSAQELIAIAGVNPIFDNCIRRSPKAQVKLLLRWSGEPQQIWYRSLNRGQHGYKQTVELTRNTGPDGMGLGQWDEPVTMSRTCPLLQPKVHGRPGKDTPHEGLAVIVARLDDLERFGDMMLTGPPTYRIWCTLCYKHTVRPTCWILGDRWAQSESPLTIRGLLGGTLREPGLTMIRHEGADAGRSDRITSTRGSFEEAIAEQYRLRGGSFELLPGACVVYLSCNFAGSDYWAYMGGKRAKLDQSSPASKEG
jgi:hypothetical protein